MNAKTVLRTAAFGTSLVLLAACSRESERVTEAVPPPVDRNPIAAESWVDEVRLTSATAANEATATDPNATTPNATGPNAADPSATNQDAATKDEFAPGETIQLSMKIDEAPQDATVTTYWYGPDNRPIAYESKPVPAGEQRLNFTQENTFDWKGGEYRAEIWVGDEKVEEESFRIGAG